MGTGMIRPPAVAGYFYPDDPAELRQTVDAMVAEAAEALPAEVPQPPKALVVPHAGYAYSGPVAASGYATLRETDVVRRVVLLGPAHHYPLRGLALPEADALATPLGVLPVDEEAAREVGRLRGVSVTPRAHEREHSLEVQLPFLQVTVGDVPVVPLVVGRPDPGVTETVLEVLWDGPETLLVVSSDLSHYLSYERARAVDEATAQAVESLDAVAVTTDRACGAVPLAALLRLCRGRDMTAYRLDLRNSADTAGGRSRVVGYGAWALA